MSSLTSTIAIYWDLDRPPVSASKTGEARHADKEIQRTFEDCLALARTMGRVGIHRAIGGPASQRTALARRLENDGVELVLSSPSRGQRRVDRLHSLIECLSLDLWRGIDAVVVISMQPDLTAAERFVRSTGRGWVVMRGTEPRDTRALLSQCAQVVTTA